MKSIPFLVVSIVLVITLTWFGVYYVQASSAMAADKVNISNLSNNNTALQSQLASANSHIATLNDQLKAANEQFTAQGQQLTASKAESANLTAQLTASKSQATSLKGQLEQANTQITGLTNQAISLQGQLQTANTTITDLQAQVSTLQTNLNAANSQVNTLTSQVSTLQTITNLAASTPLASATVVGPTTTNVTAVSFAPAYAGYLSISGSSNSTSGLIRVTDTFLNYSNSGITYAFGTSATTLVIPILPGTVNIIFDAGGGPQASATITATYVY